MRGHAIHCNGEWQLELLYAFEIVRQVQEKEWALIAGRLRQSGAAAATTGSSAGSPARSARTVVGMVSPGSGAAAESPARSSVTNSTINAYSPVVPPQATVGHEPDKS